VKDKLKHAFYIGKSEDFDPTEEQKIIVDKVCHEVVKRHMVLPATVLLETFRPLNYIGSQIMNFFQPMVTAVLPGDGYNDFSQFLEQRGSVDYLCRRINEIEDDSQISSKDSSISDI
jgi:hypothetical protein|tara:strand:+ start:352 stop:702 length:351 start_codon:yes stop_codon:yes gene_type:complete